MAKGDRSTLLTSPVSFADFVFRLAFFVLAPFAIVRAAALFPVRGALLDVGLALSVFAVSEAVRRRATRSRVVAWLLSGALAFENYYRERPPRRFVYYLFYPLLFPYWLFVPDARREFLVFRDYTFGGLVILLGTLAYQYLVYWRPELSLVAFLPSALIAIAVETLLVLALLMPIATTVVWYHGSYRRGRLLIVLLAGLVSTSIALARVARRRDPVVSYATRERVRLRTAAARRAAHAALLAAARAAWGTTQSVAPVGPDGKVESEALDRAHVALEAFYKHDEAYAFDLWANPRQKPDTLVLYFEARQGKPPIWLALRKDGSEIRKPADLPKGAFHAMRQAADGTAPLSVWPDDVFTWQEAPRAKPAPSPRP